MAGARGRTGCKAGVYRTGEFLPIPCARWATRDGFCSVHHPEAVEKRHVAQRARDMAKWEAFEAGVAAKKKAEELARIESVAATALLRLVRALRAGTVLAPTRDGSVTAVFDGSCLSSVYAAAAAVETMRPMPAGKILARVG